MTRNSNNSRRWWAVVALALVALAGCQGQAHGPESAAPAQPVAASAAVHYTCPMHPQIVREAPGSCPICKMDLVPKATENDTAPAESGLDGVLASPDRAVLASVATIRPGTAAGNVSDTLTLPGVVEYDPRRSRAVAARVGGRVEQLVVRYNYQPVRRGQKLLELYSPELVTAQQEYVFLLTNDAANTVLLHGARQKLRLLGLTEAQLRNLARTRRAQYRVAVFSPCDGYVVDTGAPAPAAPNSPEPAAGSGMEGGMNEENPASATPLPASAATAPAQLSLTEGSYVTTGQTLFQVVNTGQVWGIFQPASTELTALRPGQQLRVRALGTSLPAQTARLELVEPEYRPGASVAAVRVYLANPAGRLRRGQRLSGQLVTSSAVGESRYWLPRAAVVDLGTRQVVFVRQGAAFVAVTVQVGQRTAAQVQVISGLTGQEDIASNGQYLMDSEGFIQPTTTDAAPARLR